MRAALLFLALLLCGAVPAAAAELLMFETAGCPYCKRWDREVGAIYPRTAEGKRAPLRRIDLAKPRPADLPAVSGIVYSPTFVLLDARGREVGRIVGYSGDESFWSQIAVLMRKLDEAAARPAP